MNILSNSSFGFLLLGSLLCFQSCVSLTGYQDAKVLGKNNWEVSTSFSRGTIPDIEGEMSDDYSNSFFNLEVGGRYGVSSKTDIGLKINSNLNIAFFGKRQLTRNENSKNVFSAGFELGGLAVSPILNFQIPLYYSHYFDDKYTFNLSPRAVLQMNLDDPKATYYLGGNTGFMIGKKHKFAVDLGVYRALSFLEVEGLDQYIFNYGVGGRFFFSDNDEEKVIKKNKRPKRKR